MKISHKLHGASTSVVHNNKIWLIGGGFSQMYSSSNGKNWDNTTCVESWGNRLYHTSVVYNDKIWLFGGWTFSFGTHTYYSDSWSYDDSSCWISESSSGYISRIGHTTVTFDGKIWVLGGMNSSYRHDSIYWSTDGKNWNLATNTPGWSARNAHSSVVFDNKIWVIAGNAAVADTYEKDVWYSTNGTSWSLATSNAPWDNRMAASAVVYDNKIWLFAGSKKINNSTTVCLNDVWYSSNGSQWYPSIETIPWSARRYTTTVVFENKIWLISGMDNNSDSLDDVWCYVPDE